MYEGRCSPTQDCYVGRVPSHFAVPFQAQTRGGENTWSWAGIRVGGRLIGITFLSWVISVSLTHLGSKINTIRLLSDECIPFPHVAFLLSLCQWNAPTDWLTPFPHAAWFSLIPTWKVNTAGFLWALLTPGGEPSMLARSTHVISRYFLPYLFICDPL